MLKKRKCPREPRRIELKINNVTLVIKRPIKLIVKFDKVPYLNDTPLVPFVNDIVFDPFDIRNHKCLVQAARGKNKMEIDTKTKQCDKAAINIVKAAVEHLGFEDIDCAYGVEEVNKSIETLIKYFNCCRRKYLTSTGVEK